MSSLHLKLSQAQGMRSPPAPGTMDKTMEFTREFALQSLADPGPLGYTDREFAIISEAREAINRRLAINNINSNKTLWLRRSLEQ